MLDRVKNFARWLAADQCKIRDASGNVIPLRPYPTQQIILRTMYDQARARRPIRINVLKSRKHGVSTFIQAWLYFLCKHYSNQVAIMLAHLSSSTKEIFEASALMARSNEIDPDTDDPGVSIIRFKQTGSRYSCATAGAGNVTAGGTPTALHLSEVALWQKKKETHLVSTNSVDHLPDNCIFQESTARGRDLFWNQWNNARHGLNQYEALFFPWILNPRNTMPVRSIDLTESERQLGEFAANLYGLQMTDGQFAWRRQKIIDDGIEYFRQEHPMTPEEAVQGRTNLVLGNLASCVVPDGTLGDYEARNAIKVGGVDFGFYDPTVIGTGLVWDNVLYVTGYYRRHRGTAQDHVDALTQHHSYYCDPSGAGAREELAIAARRRNLHCSFVSAPRMLDATTRNNNPEWDRINQYIRSGQLKIYESAAPQLLVEAESLDWNPQTGRPDDRRTPETGHFDSLDMLRYMVMGVDRAQKTRVVSRDTTAREPSRREQLRS